MLKIIAAVSLNGIIGKNNKLPWHSSEDLNFFKKMTNNSIVVMGKNTFNSLHDCLPNRKNIVITSSNINNPNIECFPSIQKCLEQNLCHNKDIWFIGGASIYEEVLNPIYNVEEIYLSIIPINVDPTNAVKFPWINPVNFMLQHSFYLKNKILALKYVKNTTNSVEQNYYFDKDNNKKWFINVNNKTLLHRKNDLPAVEYANGTKEWYLNGKLHRENDKPAIEYSNGTKYWYLNGKLHRENDLPTIECINGHKEWWLNGLCHRDNDKPAIEYSDGD